MMRHHDILPTPKTKKKLSIFNVFHYLLFVFSFKMFIAKMKLTVEKCKF